MLPDLSASEFWPNAIEFTPSAFAHEPMLVAPVIALA